MDPLITSLLTQLAELTVKNSAASIAERIKTSKAAKSDQQTIGILEEIINELIDERNELQRISNALKEHIVAETISEADITYINENLLDIIEYLIASDTSENSVNRENYAKWVATLEKLLSPELLKILQLLGLNYREAIGVPLTKMIATKIDSDLSPAELAKYNTLVIQWDIELAHVALDEDASRRLMRITNQSPVEGE